VPGIDTLIDSATYGEDLAGNLERVLKIAPRHCADCTDYHIRCVAHRATGERFGIDLDRGELVAATQAVISRGLSSRPRLDIVIAGSADTGVLATVAHAAARLGEEALRRCRFTVLDLCPTPLLLCRHFAAGHGLDFRSATVDLTAPMQKHPADVVVTHSVFRFIDRSLQPGVLEELGSWLKPGGSIVFSNRIKTQSGEEERADTANRGARNERFAALTASGALQVADRRDEIMLRLDRSMRDQEGRAGEFRTAGDLRHLLVATPLLLERFEEIDREIGGNGSPRYLRKRVLAVLTAPG
jgi:hypothetical protein